MFQNGKQWEPNVSYMDPQLFDFSSLTEAQLAWRSQAVRLAVKRQFDGQAQYLYNDPKTGHMIFGCASASEPSDYLIEFDPVTTGIRCSCTSGDFGKPCGHAGAALLLYAGLAPGRALPLRIVQEAIGERMETAKGDILPGVEPTFDFSSTLCILCHKNVPAESLVRCWVCGRMVCESCARESAGGWRCWVCDPDGGMQHEFA